MFDAKKSLISDGGVESLKRFVCPEIKGYPEDFCGRDARFCVSTNFATQSVGRIYDMCDVICEM